MGRMMSAPRNRCKYNTDNPIDSDGFYRYFKKGNAGKTKQLRHKKIRQAEKREWQNEF